ncbi:GIY-YIG nuclease family protein [Lactiplantibacillus pentosus]|uniref:GIY-YIG nuclease family protein n=1 Tax=Lactiplantibacillus pentosus TaxID=1589 RepID=UPI001CDAE120|nr:GIY-YIG nuclease family protein [Lactiplantibacillus pentosus]
MRKDILYKLLEENIGEVDPVVDVVPYDTSYNTELHNDKTNKKLIFEYPTVYLIYDKLASNRSGSLSKFKVYVGETNDIQKRTRQHLKADTKTRTDWKALRSSSGAEMIVIGDRFFNKSLTLDIENKLMMYLLSADSVSQLNNRRTNPQRAYFMSDQFENIFGRVWQTLRAKKPDIFPDPNCQIKLEIF